MANIFEEVLNVIGGKGGSNVNMPDIDLPTLMQMNPELYKQVVEMNPELTSAINLGPSAMEGIALDPRARNAQMSALDQLMNISNAGGKDAQFLADSSRLQNDINSNLKGNSDAIKQDLAMRGMGGGMSELVSRNINAQQGANRQAQMGLDINAQAQQRALQALMSGAELGGNMEQQQFGQQSAVAQSKDMINEFNAKNLQNARNMNVDNINNARMYNIQTKQNTADNNVDVKNQARQYNLNIPQQQYENQLRRAGVQFQVEDANSKKDEARRRENLNFVGNAAGSAAKAFGGK